MDEASNTSVIFEDFFLGLGFFELDEYVTKSIFVGNPVVYIY